MTPAAKRTAAKPKAAKPDAAKPQPAKPASAPRTLLGAHMSVAGGLHEGARRLGEVHGRALQVFTKNSNQWAAKPVSPDDVRLFREASKTFGVEYCVSHDSYLINLAAEDPLASKSYDAFVDEIRRCAAFGIPDLVFHPGAHVGAGVEVGLRRVGERVRRALDATADTSVRVLIEITAGQGTCLGWRFEEVRDLLDLLGGAGPRVGTCFDTCHAHAAGYDLSTEESAAKAFDEFDRVVGAKTLGLFHLNDAKKPCGARVDRHEHIGQGTIGLAGFRALVADARFRDVPKVLETEKGADPKTGADYDAMNLATLRKLGF